MSGSNSVVRRTVETGGFKLIPRAERRAIGLDRPAGEVSGHGADHSEQLPNRFRQYSCL